jgi:phosphoglycolate phosphatase
MEKGALLKSLQGKGILHYFDHIIGINDHYAKGKLEFAVDFIKKNNIYQEKTILIGDTTHDFEVAEAIGCKCLLIANGHQSFGRLSVTSVPVR